MTVLYVVLTVITAYCVVASCFIVSGVRESKDIPEGTAGIVLGCTVKDNEPSVMLMKRCDRGLRYLNENKTAVLILSGGREDEINRSEAQTMFDYLKQQGADTSRLIMENKSTTTIENMIFSKKILDERGYSNKAVIITTDFHMSRSKYLARQYGIEPYGLCSHLTVKSFVKNIVREWMVLPSMLKKH